MDEVSHTSSSAHHKSPAPPSSRPSPDSAPPPSTSPRGSPRVASAPSCPQVQSQAVRSRSCHLPTQSTRSNEHRKRRDSATRPRAGPSGVFQRRGSPSYYLMNCNHVAHTSMDRSVREAVAVFETAKGVNGPGTTRAQGASEGPVHSRKFSHSSWGIAMDTYQSDTDTHQESG